jgi:hypothetical protein
MRPEKEKAAQYRLAVPKNAAIKVERAASFSWKLAFSMHSYTDYYGRSSREVPFGQAALPRRRTLLILPGALGLVIFETWDV